tara:strand:+ start:260 stop:517 length:258 start_codon:yes stop_codon:yes gene_type:complete
MSLSKETVEKLADAMTMEVIEYISKSPRTTTFLYEMVGEALCETLGNKQADGSCSFDGSKLVPKVVDRIRVNIIPNNMPSDPADL